MEQKTLEINLISAQDLKDVNLISKMDVYTVVSITGGSKQTKQKSKTPVDRSGGTNPTWNFPVKLSIDNDQLNNLILVFNLRCERALGDKDIGEVNIPVKELLDSAGKGASLKFVSYQVRKPSGKPKGVLHFSYKFSDKIASSGIVDKLETKPEQPVTAYLAPVAGSSSAPYPEPAGGLYPTLPPQPVAEYAYPPPPPPPYGGYGMYPPPPYGGYGMHPPPPQGYGYPPPPQGYGYPPPGYGYPPAGYGYPPVQQPNQNKGKFGMGLGAGLVGGMLGGLLIGDMVSDVAAYDVGYDAGFDDAAGF